LAPFSSALVEGRNRCIDQSVDVDLAEAGKLQILTATSSITGVEPVIPNWVHACRKARFIALRYSSSLKV
jgi:hypothetical protein